MTSRYPGAITQDWESVMLHKSKPKGQELRDPKAVNQALRSGAPVLTVKKYDGGSNKKTAPIVNPNKLEEGTEPAALDKVPAEVRKLLQKARLEKARLEKALDKVPAELRQLLQKARLEKKMSQYELAKQINERPQVVQEYENGRAVPNQAVLAKMEKVLGVKLRGKIRK